MARGKVNNRREHISTSIIIIIFRGHGLMTRSDPMCIWISHTRGAWFLCKNSYHVCVHTLWLITHSTIMIPFSLSLPFVATTRLNCQLVYHCCNTSPLNGMYKIGKYLLHYVNDASQIPCSLLQPSMVHVVPVKVTHIILLSFLWSGTLDFFLDIHYSGTFIANKDNQYIYTQNFSCVKNREWTCAHPHMYTNVPAT